MKYVISLISVLVLLSACARGSSENISPNTHTSEVSVNNEKAEDYYNRFLFRTTGKCSEYSIYFHFMTSEGVKIDNDVNGQHIRAKLEIFTSKNGTYTANYEERLVRYYIDNGYGFNVVFKKRIQGKWLVDNQGKLILEGLGVGSGIIYNNVPSILLSADKDIHRSGLKGQKILVRLSSTSGDSELYNSFCNK